MLKKYNSDLIYSLFEQGKTPREVSDITGIPFESVHYYRTIYNRRHTGDNTTLKAGESKTPSIAKLIKQGRCDSDIINLTKCTQQMIDRVKYGINYRNNHEKITNIFVSLPLGIAYALRQIAKQEGITTSRKIRYLITQFLKEGKMCCRECEYFPGPKKPCSKNQNLLGCSDLGKKCEFYATCLACDFFKKGEGVNHE